LARPTILPPSGDRTHLFWRVRRFIRCQRIERTFFGASDDSSAVSGLNALFWQVQRFRFTVAAQIIRQFFCHQRIKLS
jgi:hypothetical protein